MLKALNGLYVGRWNSLGGLDALGWPRRTRPVGFAFTRCWPLVLA